MQKKFLGIGLALFAMLAVGAGALWLGQFQTTVTGGIVAGGSAPSLVSCDFVTAGFGSMVWADGNGAYGCTFEATADTDMELVISDTFESVDSGCVFESGVDLEYGIALNGGAMVQIPADTPVLFPVLEGSNLFDIWFRMSENACPSNEGIITLVGTQQPVGG